LKNNNRTTVAYLTRLAVLTAVLLLMAYTPLGYLKTAGVEISFLMLPVIIGAVVLGPLGGAILGGIFGLTSFIQCFGASAFGVMLLSINPIFTFITCMLTRILAGYLVGLIFKLFKNKENNNIFVFGFASFLGSIFNTVFFVGSIFIFFGSTDYIQSFGENIWEIITILVGINGIVEAIVITVIGGILTKTLHHLLVKK